MICPWIGVKQSQITWPSSSNPEVTSSAPRGMKTFAEYSSSPGCFRGFCNQCGGTFLWRYRKDPQEVGITTGSVDESLLMGSNKGSDGPHQGRQGLEAGKLLCEPVGGHLWLENAIKGVTDEVKIGKKYLEGYNAPGFSIRTLRYTGIDHSTEV